jgi:Protein of unknown function (DUF3147)
MTQFLIRFVIGGLVVSVFAICGDVLRPKSFAGLFGAAPSVALASLGLTFKQNGAQYVAIEARSMMLGATAFLVYVYLVGQVLKRGHAKAFDGVHTGHADMVCPQLYGPMAAPEVCVMQIRFDRRSLKETRAHEYAARFLFGGLCTGVAWLIAKKFGPAIVGLFLAFPAIFLVAVSMIQDHEKRRKAEIGRDGTLRGREAAALDAFGASTGCAVLLAFALWTWRFATRFAYSYVLLTSLALWVLVSWVGYLIQTHWPRDKRTRPLC